MGDFLLAIEPNYRAEQYSAAIKEKSPKSKKEISDFLKQRFKQRYIKPGTSKLKNGFNILANCCLLIETLESFYNGWDSTPAYKSKDAFHSFFLRFSYFKELHERATSDSFYVNIRCGILHQGETKGGWRISRKVCDPLLDSKNKIINANLFRDNLELAIDEYCENLNTLSTDSHEWKMLEKKMLYIIKNCKA